MKNLSRILSRYLFTAVLLLLLTLFLNVFLYIICGFQIVRATSRTASHVRIVAESLEITEGRVSLSGNGFDYLSQHYVWAMLLDDDGCILWQWELPQQLNHPYTARQIAAFSKWYLDDYPVTERITDYGLLVAAQERYSTWKQNFSDSIGIVDFIAHMIPVTLFINLLFVFLVVLVFGLRFYRSLRVLDKGIQDLSEQKPIRLPEKGMTELLAKQLNLTSDLLIRQKERLERRDDARASWIRSVSHDIRTPLSLIMGYASDLKEDPSLPEEQQRLAERIAHQSLKIKRLIEDLNLTSRLEYEMQPLRITELKPARLLRTIVSDFYNQGLSDVHTIDLYMDPDVEQVVLSGDAALLTRSFSNLIGNSIRHNPDGCTVSVAAGLQSSGSVCFQISDDGCGIPDAVLQALTAAPAHTEKAPHIMGLRIACQIFRAHDWQVEFADANTVRIVTG